jgi:hypothetical protein
MIKLPKWKHLTSQSVVAPEAVTFADARPWCNFTVIEPRWLPSDCSPVVTGSLRKESPPGRDSSTVARPDWTQGNTCSFSFKIVGINRSLRVKQFFYDWAPPATDHPCLWESEDRPFLIDEGRVGWLGVDYKGNQAGSAILWGTMCEVSVLEGSFSDSELTQLYKGLVPASQSDAEQILSTRFDSLCYWARYQGKLVDVPFGLWRYRRSDPDAACSWHDADPGPDESLIDRALQRGWQLDCFCLVDNIDGSQETHSLLYVENRDHYMWCIIIKSRQPFEIKKDSHPCRTEVREIAGTEVHHAWISDLYGPHDAVWQADGQTYIIECNSWGDFDNAAFWTLIGSLLH